MLEAGPGRILIGELYRESISSISISSSVDRTYREAENDGSRIIPSRNHPPN